MRVAARRMRTAAHFGEARLPHAESSAPTHTLPPGFLGFRSGP